MKMMERWNLEEKSEAARKEGNHVAQKWDEEKQGCNGVCRRPSYMTEGNRKV